MSDSDTTAEPTTLDRREDSAQWRAKVDQRLDDGAAIMRKMREDLHANTITTNQVRADTSELVSLLKSFHGAFKVFNMVGKLAKPLTYIVMAATAVVTLYTTWKGGGPPK